MVHRLHAGSFSGFKKSKCKRQCYSFHLFDLSWQDLEARSYSYREWAWAVLRKLPRRWRWRKERTHPLQPHDVHVASYCASMSRSDIDSAFFAGSKALRRANVAHFFFSPFKFSKKALELGGLWFEMVCVWSFWWQVQKWCEPAAVVDRVPCSKALMISKKIWIFFMSPPDILHFVDSVQDDMYFSGLKFLQLDKVWKWTTKLQPKTLRSLHSEFAMTKTEIDLLTVNGPVDQELGRKMLTPQCPNNVQNIKINAILGSLGPVWTCDLYLSIRMSVLGYAFFCHNLQLRHCLRSLVLACFLTSSNFLGPLTRVLPNKSVEKVCSHWGG